jgi:hypothetical protein
MKTLPHSWQALVFLIRCVVRVFSIFFVELELDAADLAATWGAARRALVIRRTS